MIEPDRIMLYALIRGLRPDRVLEIGARWGGGARIIASALEDSGHGHAVGIDPEIKAFRPKPHELFNRYRLIVGYSPDAVPQAVEAAGGKFDFVFIDAMHTHHHVSADLAGVVHHMADGSHILLHDTFHVGINQAAEEFLDAHREYTDCGFLTRTPDMTGDFPVAYQGLRLLRAPGRSNRAIMSDAFNRDGKEMSFSPELIDWDPHWNRLSIREQDHA